MTSEDLKNSKFIGIVVDNKDPDKRGRVRINVINVFDGIPTEALPWATPRKDLNGNEFIIPEVGKIVSVTFDQGNKYYPQYISAEHYNVNLENKLKKLSDDDYVRMRALLFDQDTQIYRNPSEGLKIDHVYTNINLDNSGNVLVNLRDDKSVMTIGSSDADESAMLGSTFMLWADKLVNVLMGTPYLGNLGEPVVANPELLDVLMEYKANRDNYLSDHLFISKNAHIIAQSRDAVNQTGDSYKTSNGDNTLTKVSPNSYNPNSTYVPTDAETNPAARDKYDPSKGTGNNPPPPPYTGNATQLQKDSIRRAIDYTLSNGETSGRCARGTYNAASNYIQALSGRKLSIGMVLSAGGNAKEQGYFDSLTKLGYSKQNVGTLSKAQIISYLNSSNFDIGDVVSYYGMDGSNNSYARYGHTQIFTGGFQTNSNGFLWATDNRRNYSCSFVYGRKNCDKWVVVLLKAPKK